MHYRIIALQLILLSFFCSGIAADRITSRQEYINRYSKLAVKEMNESAIPASIILAQACLESGDGKSLLSRESNNHFGIKCKSTWTGERVFHDDDEKGECFRKYNSPLESYRDHSKFLLEGSRYRFLFNYDIRDYKQWAYGLKQAGYATNPRYPELLIKIIEDYNLSELDRHYKGLNSNHRWLFLGSRSKTTERNIEERNGRNAFIPDDKDTYESIAAEFSLRERQIFKYNDISKGSQPENGTPVYIQKKKGRAPRGNDYHVARNNETMWSIAQWYGLRLNALYRLNKMKKGEEPKVGQVISLRKKLNQ